MFIFGKEERNLNVNQGEVVVSTLEEKKGKLRICFFYIRRILCYLEGSFGRKNKEGIGRDQIWWDLGRDPPTLVV